MENKGGAKKISEKKKKEKLYNITTSSPVLVAKTFPRSLPCCHTNEEQLLSKLGTATVRQRRSEDWRSTHSRSVKEKTENNGCRRRRNTTTGRQSEENERSSLQFLLSTPFIALQLLQPLFQIHLTR